MEKEDAEKQLRVFIHDPMLEMHIVSTISRPNCEGKIFSF